MTTVRESAEQTQHLTFFLNGEEYGVAILRVREIIRYERITPVPMTPAFIRGVINLRGSVVPVVDLSVKFGLERAEVTPRTCIVIVEVENGEEERTVMGIVVDHVSQVADLGPDDVQDPPDFGTPIAMEYLRGLGAVDDRFVLILDIDRVLTGSELEQTAAVGERGAARAPGAELAEAADGTDPVDEASPDDADGAAEGDDDERDGDE
ncbi:MAG: chemotaxis protein CheW [Gemmatimonadota bacterium]